MDRWGAAAPPLPETRLLTVGDRFPALRLAAVRARTEGLGGPGRSFVAVSSDSEFGHLNWRGHNDDIRDQPIPMARSRGPA